MSTKRSLAVIAGNGLSMAYTDELDLGQITEDLVERLKTINSSSHGDDMEETSDKDVAAAIAGIAKKFQYENEIENDPTNDFEQLVGAFESQAITLEGLEDLVDMLPQEDDHLGEAISKTTEFAQRIREVATRIVLKTIFKRTDTTLPSTERMKPLFRSMKENFGGLISFGNLNYDHHVLATLMSLGYKFCDLSDGRAGHTHDQKFYLPLRDGKRRFLGAYPFTDLRDSCDFPNVRTHPIRLLHLHGSLTYWRRKTDGALFRIDLDVVRKNWFFNERGSIFDKWTPAVVLANTREKSRQITEKPFSLGYEAMESGLNDADHWLIVGYSFRDKAVNAMIQRSFADAENMPLVLVSTWGDDLDEEFLRATIAGDHEDRDEGWLLIDRSGAENLVKCDAWDEFIED